MLCFNYASIIEQKIQDSIPQFLFISPSSLFFYFSSPLLFLSLLLKFWFLSDYVCHQEIFLNDVKHGILPPPPKTYTPRSTQGVESARQRELNHEQR